jgi:Flp pilus assembly CpaF family ATPase
MDDDELDWITFEPGTEPSVLTTDLCEFFGGCEKCPGFTTASHPNVFRFEARKEFRDPTGNVSIAAVTIRDLVKATLGHRPDRLIIGEVRGGEAFDLLYALNTGHTSSISTLHANSASQALSRLASLTLRADVDIPYKAIQSEIGNLIHFVFTSLFILSGAKRADSFLKFCELKVLCRYNTIPLYHA